MSILYGAIAESDVTQPAEPVRNELSAQSTEDLLTVIAEGYTYCVWGVNQPKTADEGYCAKSAEAELLRREPVDELVKYIQTQSLTDVGFYEAVEVLKAIGGAKAEGGFRVLAQGKETGEGQFVGLMYFADRCDPESLKTLNEHWGKFGIPSFMWAEAVYQFGNCNYRPATENLVKALNAASFNLVDAALSSLKKMYPDGPREAATPEETKKAWSEWVRKQK